jgi:LPS-assembly lipoprotein
MSSSERRASPGRLRAALVAAAALLSMGACGFEPLYGKRADGTMVADELASVQVAVIADRSGQQLRNILLDRISRTGQPVDPRYQLAVTER